jgi:hypothetical protein
VESTAEETLRFGHAHKRSRGADKFAEDWKGLFGMRSMNRSIGIEWFIQLRSYRPSNDLPSVVRPEVKEFVKNLCDHPGELLVILLRGI